MKPGLITQELFPSSSWVEGLLGEVGLRVCVGGVRLALKGPVTWVGAGPF